MQAGRTFRVAVLAVLVVGALSGACGDDSPPRSPITPTVPPATGTPAPVVTRITLAGPTTVDLGSTVGFTATAQMSDGTTRDVTAEASWNTNAAFLQLVSPGRFTGHSRGDTFVSANLSGRSATIGNVIIVPAGTYRLVGTVRDAGAPMPGASIFVEDQGLGRTSIVTPDGSFKLFGVTGVTRVTASKDGYQTTFRDLTVSTHQSVTFDLALSEPRRDVSGRYTVTFTAAPECTSLPADARTRTYAATVVQSDYRLEVTLDGANFLTNFGRRYNRFVGTLQATEARFVLNSWYYYWSYSVLPDLFEELPDRTYFSVDGVGVTPLSAGRLSGTINGSVGVYNRAPLYTPIVMCKSSDHRVTFQK